MIDLGRDRLSITEAFGSDFETRLNDPNENNPAVISAREQLGKGKHILGKTVNPGEDLNGITGAVIQQIGLPKDSRFSSIRDRIAGREDDFLLVVIGVNNLPIWQKLKLLLELKLIGVNYSLDG